MYSGLLRSTSTLYQSCPYYQYHSSNMNIPVQPVSSEPQYENFISQPHCSAMNPGYQLYPMQQTPNHAFGVQQSSMTTTDNIAPFCHQGFTYYSVQQQVMTYPAVNQPAAAQPQEVPVERNAAQEDVLVVELERPIFPMTKPRLRWTPELHGRFNRAVQELGGYFRATPKAILQKMNVRGVTRDQLKSHLQKVRNRVLASASLEELMGFGIPNITNTRASEGGAFSSSMPTLESHIGEHETLQRSCETPNYHQDLNIAPDEDPVNHFNFEDFDLPTQTPNYHQNLRIAPDEGHAKDFNFKDSDFY